MNFHDYSKNKNRKIYFSFDSALRIFHKDVIKTEEGGICISLLGTGPAAHVSCRYLVVE